MENKKIDEQIHKDNNDSAYKYQATIFNVISSALFLWGCIIVLFGHGDGELFSRGAVFVIYLLLWTIPMFIDLCIQKYFIDQQLDKNAAELGIILGFVLFRFLVWYF